MTFTGIGAPGISAYWPPSRRPCRRDGSNDSCAKPHGSCLVTRSEHVPRVGRDRRQVVRLRRRAPAQAPRPSASGESTRRDSASASRA